MFTKPLKIISTKSYIEIPDIFNKINVLCNKYWLAGYVAYEAAYALEEKLSNTIRLPAESNSNLIWFGVFNEPYRFNHITGKWTPKTPLNVIKQSRVTQKTNTHDSKKINLSFGIDYKTYSKNITKIREWIAKGDTYQVNFTFDAMVDSDLSDENLYLFLREKQMTPYCAHINTNEEVVLSFTPELFFRKSGSKISVKPMKGTTPRGRWLKEDVKLKKFLQEDPKNKSENLMIVDLLRNDLGRICEIGSVKTPFLYEVETHKTLHQMTSTVQGKLKPEISIKEIFKNIFPSGSVTGAPKIRTMQIIHTLESGKRGVYCGAIGYISPKKKAVFSVPIRTLQKRKGKWIYRVGSGIVWDSKPELEWDECKTKCKFLTASELPDFEILESILWNRRLVYLRDHIRRMKHSAKYFNIPFLMTKLEKTISAIRKKLHPNHKYKIRIFLKKNGSFRWDYLPLESFPCMKITNIFLNDKPIDESNIFLYHKTTYRHWYDGAMKKIKKGESYDVIFFNAKGEITEGARTNIFIEKNGILITPAISCGLLPGVLRENLLRKKKCEESIITIDDIKKADKIYCGNSVRGLVRVFLNKCKVSKLR